MKTVKEETRIMSELSTEGNGYKVSVQVSEHTSGYRSYISLDLKLRFPVQETPDTNFHVLTLSLVVIFQ